MQHREPLRLADVTRELGAGAGRWHLDHRDVVGSSQAVLAALAGSDEAPDGTVLLVELQTAGRGRLGRSWQAPAGSSLMMSVLLRPRDVPTADLGWATGILALAVRAAVREVCALTPDIKWPNDLLLGGAKCAGMLAEVAGSAVVLGLGLNVTLSAAELPVATATSLQLAGASGPGLDRARLAAAVLTKLDELTRRWYAAGGDIRAAGLLHRYRDACVTIGSQVRVELPDGETVRGRAIDVVADGRLAVRAEDGTERLFAAGDVTHLRPAAVSRG